MACVTGKQYPKTDVEKGMEDCHSLWHINIHAFVAMKFRMVRMHSQEYGITGMSLIQTTVLAINLDGLLLQLTLTPNVITVVI